MEIGKCCFLVGVVGTGMNIKGTASAKKTEEDGAAYDDPSVYVVLCSVGAEPLIC